MTNIKLKSCPHCGGVATLEQNYSHKWKTYFVCASCRICGAKGKICGSAEEPAAEEWSNEACINAAIAWNMRTADGGGDNGEHELETI